MTVFFKLFFIFLIAPFHLSYSSDMGMKDERVNASWHTEIATGPLQERVNLLKPGDTLTLPEGEYVGPIHIKTSGITIEGNENKTTTITAQNKDSVIIIEANDVTLKNLTITASGTSPTQADSGIALRTANNVKLINNVIKDCLFGIDVYQGKDILIEKNIISSKNFDVGSRGDAIRLYNVRDAKVLGNKWSFSRDVVSWYSNNILFKDNQGEDSRYSIHSMYSKHVSIQNNTFKRNKVGIFLMYGSDFILANNTIERSLGATGTGIGLKDSSNIIAQGNKINYSGIGILVDNSPYNRGSKNLFLKNQFTFNSTAIVVSRDRPGGEFKQNTFVGNLTDVECERPTGSQSFWNSNYWDKYIGFDKNHDGTGDTPFIIRKYRESISASNPQASFFNGSPILTLLSLIEKVTGIGTPSIILTDENPILDKD